MDATIKKYRVIQMDKEINYCDKVAYQRDMTKSVPYTKDYWDKYVKMEGTTIAQGINLARTQITEKYCEHTILDVGIGSGEFIKSSNLKAYGFDINPFGVQWLKDNDIFLDPYTGEIPDEIEGITMWDTMEHMPNPESLLSRVNEGKYVFISIPIFEDILQIRKSKHFRPNEHYYYFTAPGLTNYMKDIGFDLVESNDHEILCGREAIMTFVFVKN